MGRTGRETIVGLNDAATWGTAVAPVANHGILPVTIDQLALQGDFVPDEAVGNFGELQFIDKIRETANPVITLPLRRNGTLWHFIAALHGDDTLTGAGPYVHTLNWQTETTIFSTMAMEINNADILEWPALKVTGYVLEPDGDGFVQLVVSTICNTVAVGSDATFDGTDADNITYDTKTQKFPSREVLIRLNEQEGGGLTSTTDDIVNITNWSVAVTRPMGPEEVMQGASTGVEFQTDEPVQSGFSEILFGFDRSDYTTLEDFDDFKDEDLKKGDMNWDTTISSVNHDLLIQFPSLKPIPHSSALDRGLRIPMTRNFQAMAVTSAPTGMSITTPIHIVQTDNTNRDYVTL